MVIVVRKGKKENGLKELDRKATERNNWINEVFVVANGCTNTKRLIAFLQIAYVAVDGLQTELKETWL